MSNGNESAGNGRNNANSRAAQEKRGDPGIRERAGRDLPMEFNVEVEYGARIALLSDEGRKNVQVLTQHGQDRLEREIRSQQASRRFREIQEENRRLKEALCNPDLRLGEVHFDGHLEIEYAEKTAKATVSRREQTYRDNIHDDIRFSIDREIAADADRRRGGPSPEAERDQERER